MEKSKKTKRKTKTEYEPCNRHPDCFGHATTEKCRCLENTDFGDKDCPFYKSKEQLNEERRIFGKRLADMGWEKTKKKEQQDDGD